MFVLSKRILFFQFTKNERQKTNYEKRSLTESHPMPNLYRSLLCISKIQIEYRMHFQKVIQYVARLLKSHLHSSQDHVRVIQSFENSELTGKNPDAFLL